MTVLNTNTAALNAQYNLKKVQSGMEDAMTALSSGKRINTAADDAAGIAITSRMTAAINGFEQAIRNAADAQGMIDTAEGAHEEVSNMLQRMRELAVQSGNDSNSDSDRAALQLEIDQLLVEMDRISERTVWGGKTLMGGETGGPTELTFQVGATSAAGDQITVVIDDTSSKALGVGGGEATFSGGRDTGHAGVSYDKATGVLSFVGQPKAGDLVTFDVNGQAVSARISSTDHYPLDTKGVAAQVKAAVDVVFAANPTEFVGTTVVDNGDGSLTFGQSKAASITTWNPTTAAQTATIDEELGTITFDGTYTAEALTLNVNGTTVSVTRAANDGFAQSNIGTATAFRQAILAEAGLENIEVTDHADGSLTITNGSSPQVDGEEITLAENPNVTIAYDDAGVITVGGTWTEGQQISMDILGKEVSITVADDDSYANTLGGVTEQLSAAINNAGIAGLTSAKTANASTLTMTADVNVKNAETLAGTQFITHTIGDNATVIIKLSGADNPVNNATAATFSTGDAYAFEILGNEVSFVVGTDGYTDDKYGVSEQMKDLIDDLNLEGVSVTADASGASARIDITRALTGTASVGSTVVTNIESLAADEVEGATFSGGISVETAAAASDAIDRIDAALVMLQEQRAELGSVSNRLDHTITNLSNVNVNLQASRSRIEDADFAVETSNLTKSQILSQAATAMLAQANASKQSVLSLLQG